MRMTVWVLRHANQEVLEICATEVAALRICQELEATNPDINCPGLIEIFEWRVKE